MSAMSTTRITRDSNKRKSYTHHLSGSECEDSAEEDEHDAQGVECVSKKAKTPSSPEISEDDDSDPEWLHDGDEGDDRDSDSGSDGDSEDEESTERDDETVELTESEEEEEREVATTSRPKMCEAHKDAVRNVCEKLGMTQSDMHRLRKALKYIAALSKDSSLWYDVSELKQLILGHFMEGRSAVEVRGIMECAMEAASNVVVPEDDVVDTFAPLHPFSGGRFTMLSKRMPYVFGVCLACDILKHTQTSETLQQATLELVLKEMCGLDCCSASFLAADAERNADSTSRLVGLVRTHSQRLVSKVNSLDGRQRLRCCLLEIASSSDVVKLWHSRAVSRKQSRAGKTQYEYGLFDSLPTKGCGSTMFHDKLLQINLVVLASDQPGFFRDCIVEKIGAKEGSTLQELDFKRFEEPSGLIGHNLYEVLRDSILMCQPPPGQDSNFRLLYKLHQLLSPKRKSKLTTVLSKVKEEAIEHRPIRERNIPEQYLFNDTIPVSSLFGISYEVGLRSKRWLKMGKRSKNARTGFYGTLKLKEPFSFVSPGSNVPQTEQQLTDLLFPPWVGYEFGCVTVYVIPDPAPVLKQEDALVLHMHRARSKYASWVKKAYDLNMAVVGCDDYLRKMNAEKKIKVKEAMDASMYSARYKRTSYPAWHHMNPSRLEAHSERRAREDDVRKGKDVFEAMMLG